MINDIPEEAKDDIKSVNKTNALQYDEELRKKKVEIIEYYQTRIAEKSEHESILEILCEVIELFEIDEVDLSNILKDDVTMLQVIKQDCMSRNLLKEKDRHVDNGDIFG